MAQATLHHKLPAYVPLFEHLVIDLALHIDLSCSSYPWCFWVTLMKSSTKNVCATGAGSARPVVSMMTASNFLEASLPKILIKSPLTAWKWVEIISAQLPVRQRVTTPGDVKQRASLIWWSNLVKKGSPLLQPHTHRSRRHREAWPTQPRLCMDSRPAENSNLCTDGSSNIDRNIHHVWYMGQNVCGVFTWSPCVTHLYSRCSRCSVGKEEKHKSVRLKKKPALGKQEE